MDQKTKEMPFKAAQPHAVVLQKLLKERDDAKNGKGQMPKDSDVQTALDGFNRHFQATAPKDKQMTLENIDDPQNRQIIIAIATTPAAATGRIARPY